jgi:hypothetical protein
MNERALKNFYTLSAFQICVIRDFWASSEISMIFLDIQQRIVYKQIKSSWKESFLGREINPQRTLNSFFAGFFIKSRRPSSLDVPKAGSKRERRSGI